jgi:hypothetical protein
MSSIKQLPHINQILHKKRWLKFSKQLAPFICEIPTFIYKPVYMNIKGNMVELYKKTRPDKESLQKGIIDEEDIAIIFIHLNNCFEMYFENYKGLKNDAICLMQESGIIKRTDDKMILIIIFLTCLDSYIQVIDELSD